MSRYPENHEIPYVFNVDRWRWALARCRFAATDRDWLLDHIGGNGREPGFNPHISPPSSLIKPKHGNNISDEVGATVVTEDIIDCLDNGWMAGPLSNGRYRGRRVHISSLFDVDKPPGSKKPKRTIHNLSSRSHDGSTINELIDPEWRAVGYVRHAEICRTFNSYKTPVWMWLCDMAEAYRRVPVRPDYRHLLGLQWFGSVYVMCCLPFGMASSCQIYQRFAGSIRRIIIGLYPDIFYDGCFPLCWNYLDDFIGFHTNRASATKQSEAVRRVVKWLGVPTRKHKCAPPALCQQILGLLYDSLRRLVLIPPKKLWALRAQLLDLLVNHKKVSRRTLAQLRGRLFFVAQVIPIARTFLRRFDFYIYRTNCSWDAPRIRLNNALRYDMYFWLTLLSSANRGISWDCFLMKPSAQHVTIWTDAAGGASRGMGGFSDTGFYFQLLWSELVLPSNWTKGISINVKELLAVVTFCIALQPSHSHRSMGIRCDNESTVDWIIARGAPKDHRPANELIRHLCLSAHEHFFHPWIRHIPGEDNIVADNLSRFKPHPLKYLDSPEGHQDPWMYTFYETNRLYKDDSSRYHWNRLDVTNIAQFLVNCISNPLYYWLD